MKKRLTHTFIFLCFLLCALIGIRANEDTLSAWTVFQTDRSVESPLNQQKEAEQKKTEQNVTLAWPFKNGPANETSATVSLENVFSATSFTLGKNLTLTGTGASGGLTFSQIKPTEAHNSSAAIDGSDDVKFSVIPKKGLTFTPTKISFKACRFGTSGGNLVIACGSDDKVTTLATVTTLGRSGQDPAYTELSYDISGYQVEGKSFDLSISIYSLANNKTLGLTDILLEGVVSGQAEVVESYTCTVSLSDEKAGKVTLNPIAERYDAGTALTASATENFGYHFLNWTDAAGKVVSESNPYAFQIEGNTVLTANYSKTNTYSLNVNLKGGANANLVTISPVGTQVDGKMMYEEGTEVLLTAINNPILTFLNWEDNATSKDPITAKTYTVTMQQDQNLTANFSACDYIVGWDLYQDQPGSERPADYKSDTENAGLLSLRKEDKTTTSWLPKGFANGLYNGKYCAVTWKALRENTITENAPLPLNELYYYETSFKTVGYSNVQLSATMGCNYNAFSVQNVEYSTDGIQYTRLGTITIEAAKEWYTGSFTLPAACDRQNKVYVRFRPDVTSAIVGTPSGLDGTGITDIFVTGDADDSNDPLPPTLVVSIPQKQDTGVSAGGSVILTFDKRVQAGTGDCTLGGEVLKGTFSGKTVVFPYSALAYNTAYTFTVPKGAITSKSGEPFEGCSITFTTMERTPAPARLFDAVIAQDGTGDYTTVQAAIDAAPAGQVKPYLIFIKKGSYKGHVNIPETKPYLHFIGQDAAEVIITDDRLCGGTSDSSIPTYGVADGATLVCQAADCYFENITFENSWGVEKNSGPQALALYTNNDRIILNKCRLLSYQDTYLTSTKNYAHRHYLKECFVEGAVDFIYGGGDAFFDHCKINIVRPSGGYIVAPSHSAATKWGYVFMNNTITTDRVSDPSTYSVWLGRPWHNNPKTVFINTTAEVSIPATGWYQTMGGLPALWAEYNTMDKNGNPVDLSNRNTYYYYMEGDKKVEGYSKAVLTAEEASQYTVKNVLTGEDAWQPALRTEACAAPAVKLANDKMTWEAVSYAICYVISKNGTVVGFTKETSYDYDSAAKYTVQAVNEFGGLSKPGSSSTVGIADTTADATIVRTEYFTVDGLKVQSPTKGIYLVRNYMSNGSIKTEKIFNK